MDIWVVSAFCLINNTARTFVYMFLCGHVFRFLGYIPTSGIAGLYDNSVFNFLTNCQTVFTVAASFYKPTGNEWGFQFLHILNSTCLLFDFTILGGMEWLFIVVLIFISLMTQDVKNLFMCLLAIYIAFLEK